MTADIWLREYTPAEVRLDAGDAEYIADRLASRLTIGRALSGDGFVLNPNQFVGVAVLPSGRRIECQPKVPIGTLFTMLAVAYDLDVPLDDEVAGMQSLPDLIDFIVRHFLDLVDARLRAGFFRDYIEVEDNLLAVRGRIVIAEDVRRNTVLRHRTFCRFTEFTHDIPDNQIIRQVVHLLTGWPLNPALIVRLRLLDATMGNITPTRFTGDVVDRFRYDRLREGYRAIHQFCRLFLDGRSLEHAIGGLDFRTFLIDMNALFETFIARSLRRRLPPGLTLRTQARQSLDTDNRVGMNIDLLFRNRGVPVLVADTKYKRVESHGQGTADIYQMLAYCVATDVPTAVLIYPLEHAGVPIELPSLAIRHTGIVIRGVTVDLSRAATDLMWEMDRLTTTLLDLLRRAVPLGATS